MSFSGLISDSHTLLFLTFHQFRFAEPIFCTIIDMQLHLLIDVLHDICGLYLGQQEYSSEERKDLPFAYLQVTWLCT